MNVILRSTIVLLMKGDLQRQMVGKKPCPPYDSLLPINGQDSNRNRWDQVLHLSKQYWVYAESSG